MEIEFYEDGIGIWETELDDFNPMIGDMLTLMVFPDEAEHYRVVGRSLLIMQAENWEYSIVTMQVDIEKITKTK